MDGLRWVETDGLNREGDQQKRSHLVDERSGEVIAVIDHPLAEGEFGYDFVAITEGLFCVNPIFDSIESAKAFAVELANNTDNILDKIKKWREQGVK